MQKIVGYGNRVLDNNRALAVIFQGMSDCYRYLGKAERFRAAAYEKVVGVLLTMKDDIGTYATNLQSLDAITGIGESIAEKIMEYLHTGKIRAFEQLKRQVPFGLLELLNISGIGPATLKLLHEQLNINTRTELVSALEAGKLSQVKGFGTKKIEGLKRALKSYIVTKRIPLKEAEKIGNDFLSAIKRIPGVQKAELAGSIRRKKDTIGDIDIVIQAAPKDRKTIVTAMTILPQVKKVLVKGTTKFSAILKNENIQADILIVNDFEFGAAMLYFTGSKEYTVKLRTIAKKMGYKINEYGIFDAITNKRLAGTTEEEMLNYLQLPYLQPEMRA